MYVPLIRLRSNELLKTVTQLTRAGQGSVEEDAPNTAEHVNVRLCIMQRLIGRSFCQNIYLTVQHHRALDVQLQLSALEQH